MLTLLLTMIGVKGACVLLPMPSLPSMTGYRAEEILFVSIVVVVVVVAGNVVGSCSYVVMPSASTSMPLNFC